MKRVSRSKTSTSGSPTTRNTEESKFRAVVSAVAVHPPSEKVGVHLQKVVAGGCYRKFDEVEADATAAARRHGKRVEQACGRQMVGFDALADKAGSDDSSTMAGRPGHQTERCANASVSSPLQTKPSGALTLAWPWANQQQTDPWRNYGAREGWA